MGSHVQLADTKVYGVGASLYGSDSREPTGAITSNSFIFVFMNAIF